jgi:uncharacterized damage-inducible protein DinB
MRRWFCFFAAMSPQAFRSLILTLDAAALDRPTHENRFSPREIAAHLADFERLFLGWLKTAAETPGDMIEVPDEAQMAEAGRYREQDPQVSLARFAEARAETVDYVRNLSDEQMELKSVCPGRGPMSVAEHCMFWLGHDIYHLEQLASVREPSAV